MLETMAAEPIREDETIQTAGTPKNRVRVGRRFITACPCVLDGSFAQRRKAMQPDFHDSLEEVPVHAEVECRRLFPVSHSEQDAAAFPVEIETGTEIDHKRPAPWCPGKWLCCPDESS